MTNGTRITVTAEIDGIMGPHAARVIGTVYRVGHGTVAGYRVRLDKPTPAGRTDTVILPDQYEAAR